MLSLFNKAMQMAHPDKCGHDAPYFEHAMALEKWHKLAAWEKEVEHSL